MIVSWKWLLDYVQPGVSASEAAERLTMSGLNHEQSVPSGDDFAIDLDVTSNRPDCLGHLGIARELAVLFQVPLSVPTLKPAPSDGESSPGVSLRIEAPDLCRLYTGQIVRGVRIGPSPAWMQDRLKTVGITPVNNVVDCTNYVMLECGQPLHAFDLSRIEGHEIVVRRPQAGEKLLALDHREYLLAADTCVIADSRKALAIAGVMGGEHSEVSDSTCDLLIESAIFSPQAVRNSARALNLHSPSSYRFERGVHDDGVAWASQRCCELILKTAGGRLSGPLVQAGTPQAPASPIRLRVEKVSAVLGVRIESNEILGILSALGLQPATQGVVEKTIELKPPAWRADLTREIDLIEEVGRIVGLDRVPDDAVVPMVASTRAPRHRWLGTVRQVLTAYSFDEAMTPSLVPAAWSATHQWWSDSPPFRANQPMLGVLEKASQNIGAVDLARQSLVPSLLEARRINEHRGNLEADLFETAHVYLPAASGKSNEPLLLGLVSSRPFSTVVEVLRQVVQRLCGSQAMSIEMIDDAFLDPTEAGRLLIDGNEFGRVGRVAVAEQKRHGLKSAPVVAEVDLGRLFERACLVRRQQAVSSFPAISRDFNFIISDGVHWAQCEQAVRDAAGELCEAVRYRETFRDERRDGAGCRRILLQVSLRSHSGTLSGEQAELVSRSIVETFQSRLAARLA